MTEEIIIDVSGCSHKSDDDCMEVPICNEYGDLIGYQSCEAQTLCPYRSQKKIERLKQENQALRRTIKDVNIVAVCEELEKLKQENEGLKKEVKYWQSDVINDIKQYRKALEKIREIATEYKKEEMCRIPLGAIESIVNEVL